MTRRLLLLICAAITNRAQDSQELLIDRFQQRGGPCAPDVLARSRPIPTSGAKARVLRPRNNQRRIALCGRTGLSRNGKSAHIANGAAVSIIGLGAPAGWRSRE